MHGDRNPWNVAVHARFDGGLMIKLVHVPTSHVDFAWKDGASKLGEACDTSGGEITGDQLKMLIARGERTLIRMDDDETPVGWATFRIDQLPNMRVFFITDLWARGARFERFFEEAKKLAYTLGCSRVRCAAKPSQQRIYEHKCGFQPVYTTLEVVL